MGEAHQFVFGPFRLDPGKRKLWRGERKIELQPRPLAVLHYLVEHSGRIVPKEELLKQVWTGTYVTKTALKVSIRAIRKALGEDAVAPRYIETVGQLGYRFIAPLRSIPPVVSSQLSVVSPDTESSFPLGTARWQLTTSFVGRDQEIGQLREWCRQAGNSVRQVVFVTGEPGIGKTTVVEAFLQSLASEKVQSPRSKVQGQVFESIPDPQPPILGPWIGRGQCLEQYGGGEAYLPVLEAFGRLCREPGGGRLVTVLAQYAPTWLVQMPALVSTAELEVLQRKVAGATRERMLREMAEAVEALTAEWGLVLVFEDLQWSDHSTLELIAYLARRREPARLMIVGTYRPTDVVVRAHPLKGIKQELQIHGQCEEIRLELLTEEDVAEYVARRFGGDAQEAVPELARLVSRRTDGNALFMVNLVNDLLSHQVIIRRDERWELRGTIADIEREVPSSIRQFIEQQIDRLSPADQHMLEVASVAGAEFSAATVAAGIAATVTAVEERCETLGRHGQFLQARGSEEWPDGTVTACYRFLHALYQDVLYERIPAGQKVELHRRIGERRERAYGDRAPELAAGLAMHFEHGREYHRAVYYLGKAGENAVRRSAHQEAIRYLTKGLELLKVLPETPERVQQELSLHLTLGLPLAATRGYAVPEIEQTYARAHALCQQIGETPLLFPALVGLWAFYLVRGRLQTAREIATQGLRLAEQAQNPAFLLEAHLGLGLISCFLGELHSARAHLEEGITVARTLERTDRFPTFFQDSEVGCLTYGASVLWHLGYPDQARARMNEAVALARKLVHPFSEAYALNLGAGLQMLCRDLPTFRQWITEALTLAQTQGFPLWVGLGTAVSGWALIEQGQIGEGRAQVHQGLALYQATGTELSKSFFLLLLAEAYRRTGQTAEGLTLLAETEEFVDATGERLYEAELYRLKGELLLQSQASPGQVKASRAKSKVTNL